jgi:hypothetical protein
VRSNDGALDLVVKVSTSRIFFLPIAFLGEDLAEEVGEVDT